MIYSGLLLLLNDLCFLKTHYFLELKITFSHPSWYLILNSVSVVMVLFFICYVRFIFFSSNFYFMFMRVPVQVCYMSKLHVTGVLYINDFVAQVVSIIPDR